MPVNFPVVRLSDISHRPAFMQKWERLRHREAHWFSQMVAEFIAVFVYVYCGVGANVAFIVGTILGQPGLGSLFNVGFAYAMGITLAVTLCFATSGGHFNPSVTISMIIFKKFPAIRGLRYIFAQILGAYVACFFVYVQWGTFIADCIEVLKLKGEYDTVMFTSSGPAGAFALYGTPGGSLGRMFLNEFVNSFIIALAIWGALDPTNHMIPPAAGPWLIGLVYATVIWGFSPATLAANTARDLGGRFMAMTIWGTEAAGGRYAAIAALTNIPATVFAAFVYEMFLGSHTRILTPSAYHFYAAYKKYHDDNGIKIPGFGEDDEHANVTIGRTSSYEKAQDDQISRV